MKDNTKNNKSIIIENCVYHSMEEFKQKFLPELISSEIVSTEEEAQKLGAQMARESINNIKFDLLVEST